MVEKQGIMMENYQEQYNQELHQQEINSNLRTLKGYFWIVVTMLVLWLLTLTRIFIVDAGIFTMAVGLSMVMGSPPFCLFMRCLSMYCLYFWQCSIGRNRRFGSLMQ